MHDVNRERPDLSSRRQTKGSSWIKHAIIWFRISKGGYICLFAIETNSDKVTLK